MASSLACAVSITPGLVRMDFQPNAQMTIQFDVARSDLIHVYLLEGDLVGSLELIDPNPDTGARSVTVKLTLPAQMTKPGKNIGYVAAKEINNNPNSMSVSAEIRAPIVVNVPYPGYYAEMEFGASDVNEGEPEPFTISVNNLGTNNLENVYAVIDVYEGDEKIKTLTTNTIRILSNTKGSLDTQMSTSGIKPGLFRAVATLYYDGGNIITKDAGFKIGTLYIQINNYTGELEQGGIQRFDFEAESKWNSQIDNVYATITFEGADVQTAGYTFARWDKRTLSGYIDTSNQPYGSHAIKITLHYADKTTVKDGTVNLVPALPEEKEPEPEKPSGEIVIRLTTTNILIAIIVLLVLGDLVWLVLKNRKSRQDNTSGTRPRQDSSTSGTKLRQDSSTKPGQDSPGNSNSGQDKSADTKSRQSSRRKK